MSKKDIATITLYSRIINEIASCANKRLAADNYSQNMTILLTLTDKWNVSRLASFSFWTTRGSAKTTHKICHQLAFTIVATE